MFVCSCTLKKHIEWEDPYVAAIVYLRFNKGQPPEPQAHPLTADLLCQHVVLKTHFQPPGVIFQVAHLTIDVKVSWFGLWWSHGISSQPYLDWCVIIGRSSTLDFCWPASLPGLSGSAHLSLPALVISELLLFHSWTAFMEGREMALSSPRENKPGNHYATPSCSQWHQP